MEWNGANIRAIGMIVLGALAILAVLCLVRRARRAVNRVKNSAEVQLLRYAAQAFREGELGEDTSDTPRSLSAMDSVYLPRIQRDFPEFSWNEFRAVIEQAISRMLRAIDERKPELVREHENLQRQVESLLRRDDVVSHKNVRFYRTAIKRYEKKKGNCSILAVTSAEYRTPEKKVQAIFETELVYVQDASQSGSDTGQGMHCPNCGAPVTSLGEKRCEYCGSALEAVNRKVWRINSVRET